MDTALDPDKYSMINFEETELRLGLPGSGKRGYLETVDLMLNLSSMEAKRDSAKENRDEGSALPPQSDPAKPPAKAQVVGWPPIRSFRKNVMAVQKPAFEEDGEKLGSAFVKVSVDGAPYLRKVDLKLYNSYTELSAALSKMLVSFPIGQQKEASHVDLLSGSDYVPTYEDKDGDWMLVGDVPWEMFVDSCKRLRIMKGSDAIGLAPRSVVKNKNGK